MENKVVRMRASPAQGIGGMFATGEGLGEIVRTASMTPPYFDLQNWLLEAVSTGENSVRVVFHDNANHLPWAWGFRGERASLSEPILLTSDTEKQITWVLQRINVEGVDNAYTLLADVGVTGAGWYAGTSRENQVVLVSLPLFAPDEEKPYWALAPMN